jgi:hypothetical protein
MTVGEECRMLAVLTTESSARTASEPVDRHHRPRPGITGTGRAGGGTALSLAAEGHVPPSQQAHSSRDLCCSRAVDFEPDRAAVSVSLVAPLAGQGFHKGKSPAGCIEGARTCRGGDGGGSGVDDGDACGGWPVADDDLERAATRCGVLDGVGSEFAGEQRRVVSSRGSGQGPADELAGAGDLGGMAGEDTPPGPGAGWASRKLRLQLAQLGG